MQIRLSIDNRFINLCDVETMFDASGKKLIKEAWKNVLKFMQNSSFAGQQNLIVCFEIDEMQIFDKTKIRMKKEEYQNVFELFDEFLRDKIYFYNQLEEPDKTDFLYHQYLTNLKQLKLIKTLSKEMHD